MQKYSVTTKGLALPKHYLGAHSDSTTTACPTTTNDAYKWREREVCKWRWSPLSRVTWISSAVYTPGGAEVLACARLLNSSSSLQEEVESGISSKNYPCLLATHSPAPYTSVGYMTALTATGQPTTACSNSYGQHVLDGLITEALWMNQLSVAPGFHGTLS